jgi:hypothetical protein
MLMTSSATEFIHRTLVPLIRHPLPGHNDDTFHFPLAPDYRLITLVQYNLLRAIMTNMAMLSLIDHVPVDCTASRQIMTTMTTDKVSVVPESLQPTELQRMIQHDIWVDIIPCPIMRDNVLRNLARIDNRAMSRDCVGAYCEGLDTTETNNGLVVWSDPWSVRGWEITEGFASRWGYLLVGCHELLAATNSWRQLRGEEPLVIKI